MSPLYKEIYKLVRKGKTIKLDKKTVSKAYKIIYKQTGMEINDISIYFLHAIEYVAVQIIFEILSDGLDKKILGKQIYEKLMGENGDY